MGIDTMLRRLLAPLLVLFAAMLALMPAKAAGFKDPIAFTKALYALPDLWQSVAQDAASRQKWLSPSLAKLVADNKKLSPENQLDYDALADGQDYAISELKVTLVQTQGSKATVLVEFKNLDSREKLTLELLSVAGEWRLNDIKYDEDRSLADDLQFVNGNNN